MQMKIPHSLVVLVVALGYFAQATPTPGEICFEEVVVPVEVVPTCPEPEIISITTVYKTVKEYVPDCGCTDDFTDFANVQLIADTACSNGLVFTALKTRKRGLFERSPACQSFSIIEKPAEGMEKRDGGLADLIGEKFRAMRGRFSNNINQNINNNDNLNENDDQERGGRGGFRGFKSRVKRSPWGGRHHRFGDGDIFDNDNQNINQNQNTNQNLAANFIEDGFFRGHHRGGFDHMGGFDGHRGGGGHRDGFGGFFGINDNTDFNVNNNVAFEDTGFFKNKRSLHHKRHFGGDDRRDDRGDDDIFDNDNQNINQNLNNNANLNADLDRGHGHHGHHGHHDHHDDHCDHCDHDGRCGDFGGFGGCGGHGRFDRGFGGFGGGLNDNENLNIDTAANGNRFRGHRGHGCGFKKRDLGERCDRCAGHTTTTENINSNYNTNINDNAVAPYPNPEPPVVETVYQPVVEYETVPVIQTVPIVEEVYTPVEVVQPVEVVVPVEIQVAPVVYEAAFYTVPGCGMPNHPSYSVAPCKSGCSPGHGCTGQY